MRGVIGGGQTKDEIDGLCGELYKCYKCLNIDFGSKGCFKNLFQNLKTLNFKIFLYDEKIFETKQSTMFEYSVDLVENDDGSRELVCHEGENQDACKCDVMFAEKMAKVNAQCEVK